jgi:hypothetical protein
LTDLRKVSFLEIRTLELAMVARSRDREATGRKR